MSCRLPSYIKKAEIIGKPASWEWNDDLPRGGWNDEVPGLELKIAQISFRGILVLSAAFAEWVAYRLSTLTDEKLLFDYIETTRACVVDLRYTDVDKSPENTLNWKDWQGPVAGALCGAARKLGDIVEAVDDGEAIAVDAVYMANLVELVVPDVKQFRSWRDWAIDRLSKLDPIDWDEPLGNPVPIEYLDPESGFAAKDSKMLLRKFLKELDPKKNRYLRSSSEMKKAEFQGTPYEL